MKVPSIAILIPAYDPDEKLIHLVDSLSRKVKDIIIVNDGSKEDRHPIFDKLKKNPSVTVLTHAVNLGKGSALKTGLNHFYLYCKDSDSVITADADGQHSAQNILEVVDESKKYPNRLILGVRSFGKNVPFRSRLGNTVTRYIFRLLTGVKISDTQTGLRGIPRKLIPSLIKLPHSGYEFEMEMLLTCNKRGLHISERAIDTIYLDNNLSSHFNPLIDSMKIYYVIFRFMVASLITTIVDSGVFILSYSYIANIFVTTYLARFFALWLNYYLNQGMTFHSPQKISRTFPKYILLVIAMGFMSSVLTVYFVQVKYLNVVAAKILAEMLLYLANFTIQRDFIFGRREETDG